MRVSSLRTQIYGCVATALLVTLSQSTSAQQQVRVTITNNAPTGGVGITPVWIGFHSGSFDSYNGGLTAQPGLESIAEDGSTTLLSTQFNDFDPVNGGYTYVDTSGMSPVDALVRTGDLQDQYRLDDTIGNEVGPPPILPGQTLSETFVLRTDDSNRYFSYVSMVLPSNDFFVANGDPLAHDLESLFNGGGPISINVGGFNASAVNDAGTEAETYVTSAANGLFGLTGGQNGPDQPAGSLGLPIANVVGANPLDALNFVEGAQPLFDFNNGNLYPNGIATITLTAVPEPSTMLLTIGLIGSGLLLMRRRG